MTRGNFQKNLDILVIYKHVFNTTICISAHLFKFLSHCFVIKNQFYFIIEITIIQLILELGP